MKLLLDSHAFLWFVGGDDRLSVSARAAIEDAANLIYVSHATAWEVAIKLSLGKLSLSVPFQELFPGELLRSGIHELPMQFPHFSQVASLPMLHRDPFDRLLVA